jgi:methylamine---glutamate N-methyltransferase subunit B
VRLDCDEMAVREINSILRALPDGVQVTIASPRGQHNLAVGLANSPVVKIEGNAGYFVGGLSGGPGGGPDITVEGFVGWSVGENLMTGSIRVCGSASQSAGASAHGGTIVIEGDASLRAGISLKGGNVLIAGDTGAMSGFMAQAGTILIGGNAGPGLGDSLYEAVIYVAGDIASLGADARRAELTEEDVNAVAQLAGIAGFDHIEPEDVKKVDSARSLYHFATHNHRAY